MEEYDYVPVSSFGSALLRGMGWSEGSAIGNTNKGVCEPIEYIPRHKGGFFYIGASGISSLTMPYRSSMKVIRVNLGLI